MKRFLLVTRGEHHDENVWYPEVFELDTLSHPLDFFRGALSGVVSIWGEGSEALGWFEGELYSSDGLSFEEDMVRWRPRSDDGKGAWVVSPLGLMCQVLLSGYATGGFHYAIEMGEAPDLAQH